VRLSSDFGRLHYVLATYLGTVVAVILKLTWSLVFSGLKLLEPFHQLSKPDGATAKESLMADYLSASYGLSHVRHIFSGHWAMLFSTVTCILVGLLSPLSSELVSIIATQLCDTASGKAMQCGAVWVINTATARVLQAVLFVTTISLLLVVIFNLHRKSGVFSNPSSIATIASLLSHESTRQDLAAINQASMEKETLAFFEHKRYRLTSWTDTHNESHYGIVNINNPTTPGKHAFGNQSESQTFLPES
jgi:hypothetical protein